ncbi:uncharacterized protein LOC113576263 [Electrophorus electricus]|uniref:uncharacterized protein LOC113576263 n=1 Tax=Electrophorus electricus TaxID=8005 RepID=UPI000F09CA93|nr:uncharacterized protein LOC113576263 [Electrophorus electricus]
MATLQTTFDLQPDTEGILSVKRKMKEREGTDILLLSNLDFAEKIMRHSPLSKVSTLLVKSDRQCVRIGKADNIIYTVTSEDGQRCVDCLVYCLDYVTAFDISSIHFSVHSCQDEITSCFTQANNALSEKRLEALRIECNRFAVMYTTRGLPRKIVTIKTKCRFLLDSVTVEALLERKCWLQKEKAHCTELKACLDYLIEKYLTTSGAPKGKCKFILQGDGEIVDIVAKDILANFEQYVLMSKENSGVSMYPPCFASEKDEK